MFDLDASIFPGSAAAGLYLGQTLKSVVAVQEPRAVEKLYKSKRLQFGEVDVWIARGRITQIGLLAGYRGKIDGQIGIGTTLEKIEALWGPIKRDRDLNWMVQRLPGWCFTFPGWEKGRRAKVPREEKVNGICVYSTFANE